MVFWEALTGDVESEKGKAVRKWWVELSMAPTSQGVQRLTCSGYLQAGSQFRHYCAGIGHDDCVHFLLVQQCGDCAGGSGMGSGIRGGAISLELYWLGTVSDHVRQKDGFEMPCHSRLLILHDSDIICTVFRLRTKPPTQSDSLYYIMRAENASFKPGTAIDSKRLALIHLKVTAS